MDLSGAWKGWTISRGRLVDPSGNRWTPEYFRWLQGVRVPETWKGWTFESGLLYDDTGKPYKQSEIKEIYWNRQIIREINGDSLKVRSLKKELERRIELNKMPEVVIKWGTETVRIKP